MEKKPNPVKATQINDDSFLINIDMSLLKARLTNSPKQFSFILQQSPQPSPEGHSTTVIYDVKGYLLKAG